MLQGQVLNNLHRELDQLTPQEYQSALYFSEEWTSTSVVQQIAYVNSIQLDKPDSAIFLLHDAAKKSLYIGYDAGVATALTNLATRYVAHGRYDIAKMLYRKALPFVMRGFQDKKDLMAIFYANMSYPYHYSHDLDSMAYWLYRAEKTIQGFTPVTQSQRGHVGSVYNTMAALWSNLEDPRTALEYSKKAISVVDPFKNAPSMSQRVTQIYFNAGEFFARVGQIDSAREYFQKSLSFKPDNPATIACLADLYMEEGQAVKAVPMLNHALELANKEKDANERIEVYFLLGKAYYLLKDPRAEKQLLDVISKANRMGYRPTASMESFKLLSQIYADRKMHAKAYYFQTQGMHLKDSLLKNDDRNAMLALEIKSRTALKDIELAQKQVMIARSEAEIKQKNIWIGAITVGALLTIALLIALYRSNLHKQRLREETINSMMQEREISNLKSIMKGEEAERTRLARELHDGIMVQLSTVMMNLDTLPEVYRQSATYDYFQSTYYRQIVAQLSNATRELRQTAHNLMPDMLLDGGLPEALYYFCTTLQKNTGIHISFQQHGELPRLQPEFEIAVYRIVQELLQNVLKHAKATKTIVQLAHPADELLTVTVEDNGSGMTLNNFSDTSGMGLKSIRTRIRALNGNMEILSSREKGTTVYLEFDITLATRRAEKIVVSNYH